METLGLDISTGKSICSSFLTEFAKKLKGPYGDISPLGPGLLLYTLRNRYYICMLIFEMLERNLCAYSTVFPQFIDSLPPKFRRYKKLIIWFVAMHLRQNKSWSDLKIYENLRNVYFNGYLTLDVYTSLLNTLLSTIKKDMLRLYSSIKYTLNKGIFVTQSKIGLPDWTELIFLPLVPSTYIIILGYFQSLNDISKYLENDERRGLPLRSQLLALLSF